MGTIAFLRVNSLSLLNCKAWPVVVAVALVALLVPADYPSVTYAA